jgi:NAD-dependent SIR2 family protein deacetylase
MNTIANLQKARMLLQEADALFITAGAGMGVDSGLPDFRGAEGFWQAYPKARELGLRFEEMANPEWFESDPHLAWAFYGHRLHLYRDTMPHEGFRTLLELSKNKKYQSFIFTSNVDGQFQKAGFPEDRVMECHGSIHHLQCIDDCEGKLWPADKTIVEIGEGFSAKDPLPACPDCGRVARPNILMFGDFGWNYSRSNGQRDRLVRWMDRVEKEGAKLAIIEMGAGTAIPTVRNTSEQIARRFGVPLIRINPRESQDAEIGIALGAVEALDQIIEG